MVHKRINTLSVLSAIGQELNAYPVLDGMERHNATTTQQQKFIEAAREHGCDEDEAALDAQMRQIAKVTPKPEGQPDEEKAHTENE